ncbi:hypothetical protein [Coralloluteibacterium thermophilus]|uniref:PE-PGRS family protein n=1 Tax=Coralloluteibacterium thermophilum TaxID=2707049 RepID=A0ABV9NJ10_9GAMM
MAVERIIDYIGVSDEEVAHLRLILRKLARRLPERWTLGPEARADMVLVDPGSVAGDAAQQRAFERGVPCVAVRRADGPEPFGRTLRLPLREDEVHDLLAGFEPSGGTVAPVPLISHGIDFFVTDIGEDFQIDPELLSAVPDARLVEPVPADDAVPDPDVLFRRDPFEQTVHALVPGALDSGTEVEYVAETSARAAARAEDRDPLGAPAGEAPNVSPRLHRRAQDEGSWPLRDYLLLPVVRGPSRIQLAGLPPLVIDPKREAYDAPVPLPDLELYCIQPLRRADWHPLSSAEIEALHASGRLRPWRRLLWMDRLVASGGNLDPHFDRAGTFWITRPLDIEDDYPHHARIVAAMAQPRRLHEIAQVAEAPMGDVFDVVNAFDAIGDLAWEPKVREEWEARMGRERERREALDRELAARRRELEAEADADDAPPRRGAG